MEQPLAGTAAVQAALAPYPWRRLTPQRVVRRVLATIDGGPTDVTAAADDPRVAPLLAALSGVPWRALSTEGLCRLLLAALDAWRVADLLLDLELAWLLDESP